MSIIIEGGNCPPDDPGQRIRALEAAIDNLHEVNPLSLDEHLKAIKAANDRLTVLESVIRHSKRTHGVAA